MSANSGELGELFNAKSIVQVEVDGCYHPHCKWVHTFFAGWTPRFGNKPFFNIPLERETVLKALKKVEGVEEVHNLRGVYDIIARIKVDTMDKLKSIMKIVGGNDKVTAKLTVLIRERG